MFCNRTVFLLILSPKALFDVRFTSYSIVLFADFHSSFLCYPDYSLRCFAFATSLPSERQRVNTLYTICHTVPFSFTPFCFLTCLLMPNSSKFSCDCPRLFLYFLCLETLNPCLKGIFNTAPRYLHFNVELGTVQPVTFSSITSQYATP